MPRNQVIDHSEIGTYHCWNRFVRQMHLAGVDPVTGVDRSHRKLWFLERLQELAHIYLIDVLSTSIMSTHYHLILRNRPDLVAAISDAEVVRRWRALYALRRDEGGRPAELALHEIMLEMVDAERLATWRERLGNISWFIKNFSETIARRANADDGVSGAFFAHRFLCKRLADEAALIACMNYVELNELRSGQVDRPEASRHSSLWYRVQGRLARRARLLGRSAAPPDVDTACGEDALENLADRYPSDHELDMAARLDIDRDTAERSDMDYWLCPIDESRSLPCLAPRGRAAEFRSDLPAGYLPKRHGALPMTVDQFLKLVDWSGRQVHVGKAGVIPKSLAPILERLGVREAAWQEVTEHFNVWFLYVAGRVQNMLQFARRAGLAWVRGLPKSRKAFD